MEASEIQQLLSPLMRSLDKMDAQITRIAERLDNLPAVYVARTEYEPRSTSLEKSINQLREDVSTGFQRLQDRIENGERQVEDRLQKQAEARLSEKDRHWIKLGQMAAWGSMIVSLFSIMIGHIAFK